MSWRKDSNGSALLPWRFHLDVTVDASGKTGTADTDGTSDAQVVLPATLDHLWVILGGSTDELLVTKADGITPLGYQLTDAAFSGSADASARDVGIQVEDAPIRYGADTRGRLQRFRIYYGLGGYTPSYASFTPASPLTGTIELGLPPTTSRALTARPALPGQTLAAGVVSKTSEESVFVWVDVTALLERRARPYARSITYEEVLELLNDTETLGMREISAATVTRLMVDMSLCAVVTLGDRTWLKIYVTAGADGTDYAVIVPFRTTLGQVLQARFRVQVRDVDDT